MDPINSSSTSPSNFDPLTSATFRNDNSYSPLPGAIYNNHDSQSRPSTERKSFKTEYKSQFTPFDQYVYNEVTDSFVKHQHLTSPSTLSTRNSHSPVNISISKSNQDLNSLQYESSTFTTQDSTIFEPNNSGDNSKIQSGPWYKEVVKRNEKANEYRFKSEVVHNSPLVMSYNCASGLESPYSPDRQLMSPSGSNLTAENPTTECARSQTSDSQPDNDLKASPYRFTPHDYKRDPLIANMANNNNFNLPKEQRESQVRSSNSTRTKFAPTTSTARSTTRSAAQVRARSQSTRRVPLVSSTTATSKAQPATKSNQTTPVRAPRPKTASVKTDLRTPVTRATLSTTTTTSRVSSTVTRKAPSTNINPKPMTRSNVSSTTKTVPITTKSVVTSNSKPKVTSSLVTSSSTTRTSTVKTSTGRSLTSNNRPINRSSNASGSSSKTATTKSDSSPIKSIKTPKAIAAEKERAEQVKTTEQTRNDEIKLVATATGVGAAIGGLGAAIPALGGDDKSNGTDETNDSTIVERMDVASEFNQQTVSAFEGHEDSVFGEEQNLIFTTTEAGNMLADELAKAEVSVAEEDVKNDLVPIETATPLVEFSPIDLQEMKQEIEPTHSEIFEGENSGETDPQEVHIKESLEEENYADRSSEDLLGGKVNDMLASQFDPLATANETIISGDLSKNEFHISEHNDALVTRKQESVESIALTKDLNDSSELFNGLRRDLINSSDKLASYSDSDGSLADKASRLDEYPLHQDQQHEESSNDEPFSLMPTTFNPEESKLLEQHVADMLQEPKPESVENSASPVEKDLEETVRDTKEPQSSETTMSDTAKKEREQVQQTNSEPIQQLENSACEELEKSSKDQVVFDHEEKLKSQQVVEEDQEKLTKAKSTELEHELKPETMDEVKYQTSQLESQVNDDSGSESEDHSEARHDELLMNVADLMEVENRKKLELAQKAEVARQNSSPSHVEVLSADQLADKLDKYTIMHESKSPAYETFELHRNSKPEIQSNSSSSRSRSSGPESEQKLKTAETGEIINDIVETNEMAVVQPPKVTENLASSSLHDDDISDQSEDEQRDTSRRVDRFDDIDDDELLKLSNHLTNSDDEMIIEPPMSTAKSTAVLSDKYNEEAIVKDLLDDDDQVDETIELADGSNASAGITTPTTAENRLELVSQPPMDLSPTNFSISRNITAAATTSDSEDDANEDILAKPFDLIGANATINRISGSGDFSAELSQFDTKIQEIARESYTLGAESESPTSDHEKAQIMMTSDSNEMSKKLHDEPEANSTALGDQTHGELHRQMNISPEERKLSDVETILRQQTTVISNVSSELIESSPSLIEKVEASVEKPLETHVASNLEMDKVGLESKVGQESNLEKS